MTNYQTTTDEPVVVTEGLTKHFGDFVAVADFDLQVKEGSVVSLLGPNGAGKTTIVRMLATLSEPTSGTARVCGYDVVRDADKVRSVLSLTGQFAALEDNLTAQENLLLMARLRGYSKASSQRIVEGLIDRFDIGEFREKLIKSVSGGQRRRVDLAASLVVQPRILILDEPTTGLDPRSRQVVWSTIRELVGSGVTLFLTTQYLEEADALADHIVLIDHGRATAAGTSNDLKALIGDQRVDVTAADISDLDTLVSVPAPHELSDLAAVTAALENSRVAIDEIALRRPTLDDAFLALTGQTLTSDQENNPEEVVR
jgi:daunorubicin resistance ABC transporter ATP-binding subunit